MTKGKTLTDVEVAELCAAPNTEGWDDGLFRVGPHLFIQVRGNSRSWQVRWYVGQRVITMGLGSTTKVTHAVAKRQRDEAMAHVEAGRDPRAQRPARQASAQSHSAADPTAWTFKEAGRLYLEAHEDTYKSRDHALQWARTLRDYAYPHIGDVALSDININHVVETLQPIWRSRNETAVKLLGRIALVLDWAEAERLRAGRGSPEATMNVARSPAVRTLLGNVINAVKHYEALPYIETPALWQALVAEGTARADAVRLIILTVPRPNVALGAVWEEVDLERRVWTVPASRMKRPREHRIPLAVAAIEMLEARGPGTGLIFPSDDGGLLDRAAPRKIIQRLTRTKATAHGFRTTFSSWCDEVAEVPRDIREKCLAHEEESDVVRRYSRTDFLERRRVVMQRWADYVTGGSR